MVVSYVLVKIECSCLFFVSTVSDLLPDNAAAFDPGEEWVAAIDALCEVCMNFAFRDMYLVQ